MLSFVSAMLISAAVSALILRWTTRGGRLSDRVLDNDLESARKLHVRPVPRIGGLGVFAATLLGEALVALREPGQGVTAGLLLLSATPAFVGGLAEDTTGRVAPSRRLAFMTVSCVLAFGLVGAVIPRVDVPWLDPLIAMQPVAIALSLIAILTITNAVNIIDGLHGLAGVVCMIMLMAIAYVAMQVGDSLLVSTSLVLAGAIAGFLIWNYPRGLIMLGDGGAYFLGFMLAALAILIVVRNPKVSAWFPVLLLAYPLVEMCFTVYRRKILRDTQPHLPDAAHLHQLIFRRVVRWAVGRSDPRERNTRNALSAPYLWVLSSLAVAPAALWFDRGGVLACLFGLFVLSYLWLYFRIVRMKVPRWIRLGRW